MASESNPPRPGEEGREVQRVPSAPLSGQATVPHPRKRLSRRRLAFRDSLGLLVVWLGMAYLIMPAFWKGYTRRHPALEDLPRITHTADGIPGDPLNVALLGTRPEVMKIMVAARWYPSDPLTFRSCLEIAEATVLRRPYEDAPVSSLYLWGRKEDLAFEQPVGNNPRKRHHVRLWRSDVADPDGRPVWVGAAVFDERVGLSHTTGQFTHHTAADVDAERDYLFRDLEQTRDLAEVFIVRGFHKVLKGRNGEGDPWHTDGDLYAGVIKAGLLPSQRGAEGLKVRAGH